MPAFKAALIASPRALDPLAMAMDRMEDMAAALTVTDLMGITVVTGTGVAAAGITLVRAASDSVARIRRDLSWAFAYDVVGIFLTAVLLNPVAAGAATTFSRVSIVGSALPRRCRRPAGRP